LHYLLIDKLKKLKQMAVQASKSVSVTDFITGKAFKISANNILNFLAQGANTQITYIDNRGKVLSRLVTESLATINTAAARTQAVTQDGVTIYINSDRIIFIDDITSSRMITYDAGVNVPAKYFVSESAANINTAAGNTFAITTQASPNQVSVTRYINNLRIDQITAEAVSSQAVLQLLMRPESYTVTAAGTGFTSAPSVAITGGGGTGATATSTLKLLSSVPAVAGSGYAPADTITLAGGTSTTTAIANVVRTKLVSVAVNATGAGYVAGDTITLAGGTFSTAAVLTVLTETGGAVTTFSISTAGSYTVNTATFTQGSTSGSGTGATFNTALYGVESVTVNTAGVYTVLPANPIAQASTSGGGTGATLTGTWGVNTVVLGANGSGYSSMPTVTISGGGGTGATATAVMEGDSITVVSGGSGYTTTPTISFTGGGGTLLAATATIDLPTETVASATVTVRGGGYTSFPDLVLSGGLGAFVIYDAKGTAFQNLQVAQTAAAIQTIINAL